MKTENLARNVGMLALACLIISLGFAAYWFRPRGTVNAIYGQSRGRASTSVNGTSVFTRMFKQNGAKVHSYARLSPRLAKSDVIVWTPNSFELPSVEEIKYLEEDWLSLDDHRSRTLIYVARDYDATIDYWKLQADKGQGTDHIESARQRARAMAEHAYMRSLTGKEKTCKWFSIKDRHHTFTVAPSTGAWNDEIDQDVRIPVSGVLHEIAEEEDSFGFETKVLLGSAETPLILEIRDDYNWPEGQILVLLNGSSVLNYPLVNHENRKLAGQIIEYCNHPERVTFLESGPMGLPISRSNSNAYSGFEAFTVWPMNAILLHLVAAGILFCAMAFPIFGRPKELVTSTPNDFGKHVDAMQRLLELADDKKQAIETVNQYRQLEIDPALPQQTKKPDSGNPFKVSQA